RASASTSSPPGAGSAIGSRHASALTTAASSTRAAAPTGSHIATCEPALSATAPVSAQAADWPTIVAEPSIVITVAERPCGARSAYRLYRVTHVGPMHIPAPAH